MNDDIKCVNCGNVDPFTQLTLCETCGRHICKNCRALCDRCGAINCPQQMTDASNGLKKVCPDCECELEEDLRQKVFTTPATIDQMISTLRYARGTLGGDTPIVFAYYGDNEGSLEEFEVRDDYAMDGEPDRHRCYLKDAEAGDRRVLALMI